MRAVATPCAGGIPAPARGVVFAVLAVVPLATSMADTTFSAYYTGELLANTGGGIRAGSAYLSDAGLTVEAEFTSLFGGAGADFFAYFLWNNSDTFSDRYVGDAQVVSNIDAEQAVRVYEFWYEQNLNDDVSMRLGLYDLNAEFDSIETAGLFINSSHGIGADYGQSGLAGPSIFPVTSLAARFEMAISERNQLRYALLDGVPGDPADPSKTRIDLGGGDGVLHALEYNHTGKSGARFGIGGWLYSADFDRIEATTGRARDDGNRGFYAFVEAPVFDSETGVTVNGFLRYGMANDELNAFDRYLGAGVVAAGLISSRPDDEFGLALASARTGGPFRRAVGGADSRETSIELTYSAQVTNWLRIQPDIQFVVNPGADPGLKNALVIGLRFELATEHAIAHERRKPKPVRAPDRAVQGRADVAGGTVAGNQPRSR